MHRRELEVVQPCDNDWAQMRGTSSVRHCSSCSKNVYNLSMLTEREAKAALAVRPASVCVRYHYDAEGRVLFHPEDDAGRRQAAPRYTLAAALTVSAMSACTQPSSRENGAPPVLVAPIAVQSPKGEAPEVARARPQDEPAPSIDAAAPRAAASPDAAQAEECDPRWEKAFEKQRKPAHVRMLEDHSLLAGGLRRDHSAAPSGPAGPTRDEVVAALHRVTRTMAKCAGSGVATVDIRIAGQSGRVTSVSATGVDAAAAACLERAVRSASFPKFKKKTFRLGFPFKFSGELAATKKSRSRSE